VSDGAENPSPAGSQHPIDENLRSVAAIEEAARRSHTLMERVGDLVVRFAGSGTFIFLHVAWFLGWMGVNLTGAWGIRPFDPFPFTFLTLVVSLEAIFLSAFVLLNQNRMSRQADERAALDLQINMLAEQESTQALDLLRRICERLEIPVDDAAVHKLSQKTSVESLASDIQSEKR
jgi:uncharacterized membrane protein